MQAIILCGGKGSRFKSVSAKPKILAKFGKKNLLDLILNQFKLNKISKPPIFLLGNQSHEILSYLKSNKIKFKYFVEKKLKGTAGSLTNLKLKNELLLIIMGDLLFNVDLKKFVGFHKKNKGDISFFTHPNNHPADSDLIKVDENNKVKKIYFKNRKKNYVTKNLVMSGIYLINSNLINLIKKNSKSDLTRNFINDCLKKGKKILSYNSREYTKDIGTKKRYYEALKDFNSGIFKKKTNKCIFLDRDGVINYEAKNFRYSNPTKLFPTTIEAIRKINDSQYLVVIITNQPAIAKGFISQDNVNKSHDRLETVLGKNGVYLDDIYYCPHHPHKGFKGEVKKLKIKCNCRKPNSGMIDEAIKKYNINRKDSIFIGNSLNDHLAAKKAFIRSIIVNNKKLSKKLKKKSYNNLLKAVSNFLKK